MSDGGQLERTVAALDYPSSAASFLRWADDGAALLVNSAPRDRGNVWRLPLDGGEPQRLTEFTDEVLFWFETTPDGEGLVVSSGRFSRDAFLIRDFL